MGIEFFKDFNTELMLSFLFNTPEYVLLIVISGDKMIFTF